MMYKELFDRLDSRMRGNNDMMDANYLRRS